jgi:O-antigen/teichoic acid export membrane protein
MKLGQELARLGRHSVIYGLGGLVSRILAVLLLPLYTSYLAPSSFGRVETLTAATAVAVIVLRMGVSTAFFRFYFDHKDAARRLAVVRTSFWFTMTMATVGLVLCVAFAGSVSQALQLGDHPELVRAAAIGFWAQMNFEQMTSLFRVEERSIAFALASIANVLITIGSTLVLVVGLHEGALGLLIGNFVGTLCVYAVLLGYRHEQLGLQFDRGLFRGMQRFGLPLVPSALALWAINFIDRVFIGGYKGQAEVGVYSAAIKIASVITFAMFAFRTAWPAFAYSIEDDHDAKRTYSFVLTYLLAFASWIALGLGALAPWLVEAMTDPRYQRAEKGVALLAFAGAVYAGYTVLAIGSGRARRTQLNWIVTGAGAAVNVGLIVWLVPRYGMVGAAFATLAAYLVLFIGMTWYAQHVYPVSYQWRRVATALGAGAGLTVAARAGHLGLAPSVLIVLAYPLVLALLGFYLPAERARLRRLVPILR